MGETLGKAGQGDALKICLPRSPIPSLLHRRCHSHFWWSCLPLPFSLLTSLSPFFQDFSCSLSFMSAEYQRGSVLALAVHLPGQTSRCLTSYAPTVSKHTTLFLSPTSDWQQLVSQVDHSQETTYVQYVS